MRKIITSTFITLDGVMQAPGGSQEDTSDGFKYGGWQYDKYEDEISGNIMQQFVATPFDLLLGHRTYDIFAGFWPHHKDVPLFGKAFDKAKKYVVARNPFKLSWDKSELITGDVESALKELKKSDGPDLWVWGSGNLMQTLLRNNLIDRMHLWIHPVTLGMGKKLFAQGTRPERFKQVDAKITSTGVLFATYEPLEPIKAESI